MALDSALHLKQTEAFINERPIEVIMRRRAKVATTAGGHARGPEVPLPPVTVRKVAQGRIGALTERTTEDGRTVVPTAVVIAMPTADIKRGDHFTFNDIDHEILFVNDTPEWRLSAEVLEHV